MDETQCAKCGTPAPSDAKFCESCGAPIVTGGVQPTQEPPAQPIVPPAQPQAKQPQQPMQGYQQPQQPMQGYMQVGRKKPWLAALLGILIVGLGHMYLGMWAKGIGLLVIGVIATLLTGGLLGPVFWIISCVWAYFDAKNYNRKAGYLE